MSARVWPFVPFLFLLLCICTQAVLFTASRGQPGLKVEENYYEKAQRWDEPGAAEARALRAAQVPARGE